MVKLYTGFPEIIRRKEGQIWSWLHRVHSPTLKKISNKNKEEITWSSNWKKIAMQISCPEWTGKVGTAKDARQPRHHACLPLSIPCFLPPFPGALLLLGVSRSSWSTRDESADVSWGFWSYRLALERRTGRTPPHAFLLLFTAYEWNDSKQFSKGVP